MQYVTVFHVVVILSATLALIECRFFAHVGHYPRRRRTASLTENSDKKEQLNGRLSPCQGHGVAVLRGRGPEHNFEDMKKLDSFHSQFAYSLHAYYYSWEVGLLAIGIQDRCTRI